MRLVYPILTVDGVKTHAYIEYHDEDRLDHKLMVLASKDGDPEKWVEVDHYEEIFPLPGGGNASISINLTEPRTTFDDVIDMDAVDDD